MKRDVIIPVVFSTDHNFIMPTGVAILSMLNHSYDCTPYIYIFQSNDVTVEDQEILKSIGNRFSVPIDFISVGNTFNNCFEIRGITIATYYRLLIPWLIPEHDKVLYCDGDIIFNQSVSNIYAFDIEDAYVAGVQTGFKRHTETGAHIERLGLDVTHYINGGVLLINSKKQRELDLKKKFMAQARNKYKFQDQDIINIVCKDHIALMPRRFNTTLGTTNNLIFQREQQTLLCDDQIPVIIHYTSGKPWKEFTYLWILWWKTYRESPFFDPNLEFKIERNTLTKKITLKRTISKTITQKYPNLWKFYNRIRYHYF